MGAIGFTVKTQDDGSVKYQSFSDAGAYVAGMYVSQDKIKNVEFNDNRETKKKESLKKFLSEKAESNQYIWIDGVLYYKLDGYLYTKCETTEDYFFTDIARCIIYDDRDPIDKIENYESNFSPNFNKEKIASESYESFLDRRDVEIVDFKNKIE